MNENYLHLIWKQQRFLASSLQLTDKRTVQIKHPGIFNEHLSGPDFELGRVIIDKLEWCGPIELHVRASDWYKHNHHLDEAYKNVILHVVYENDLPVLINDSEIPTLELKCYLSLDHFLKFSGLKPNDKQIICSQLIREVNPKIRNKTMENALFYKLDAKKDAIRDLSKTEQFYRLLAASFGMGINKKPFEELAATIPWSQLSSLLPAQRFHLLFVTSGLLSDRRDKVNCGGFKWNFKGTRPSNFPSKRISQLAELVSRLPVKELSETDDIDQIDRLFTHFLECSDQHTKTSLFSKSFIRHLKINTIVPFIWQGRNKNEEQLLRYLASFEAEQNAIIKQWKQANIPVINALDSQGLIALHRYNCCEKKCLSCGIGKALLNKTE